MSRAQDFLDFLDGPLGSSFTLKPEEAMAFFAAKGLKTSFDWRDMIGSDHVASFTVAKMMDTDLLADVHASLLDAMANGTPFRRWADTIVPTLQAKGWWGRQAMLDPVSGQVMIAQLGSPGRLQTIFRTNMQTAYAAGAWAQIQDQAEVAPFLLYDAVDDHRTRPEHAAWDGQVHPVDSPFWQAHYPPNGWNCRCSVIQLSQDDLDAMGLKPTTPAPEPTYNWTNPRTGKAEKIPQGLDPGWNYNPGQDYLKHLAATAIAKARALPPTLTPAALKGLTASEQAAKAALDADLAMPVQALGKATDKRAAMKAAERAAQAQLDQAVATKAPYLSTAIQALVKTKAGKAMAPGELLAAAQAKAAQAKASANLSAWKAAYLADKAPSPLQQAAFDGLPDDAQGALLQQLDGIKADTKLQAAAQTQLDAIAAQSAGTLEAKALAKLAPQGGKPTELLAAVQADVAAQKAAISQATTLAGLKKSLIAGKTPTANQAKLMAELSDDAKAALLADVDAAKAKAVPPPPPAPEATKPAQLLTEPAAALNADNLVQIGPQKGSNPGGLYQDPDTGVKWYIKRPSNAEQARNEVLAAKLYEAAGLDVPELRLTVHQGQTAIASRIVDGLESATPAQLAKALGTADGFVTDAWLANWDVVGAGFDNLLVKGGRALRVDTGGALRFRAQGGLKGAAFGDDVLELDTLRNAGTNPQSAAVFKGLTRGQLEDGARRVLAIPEARIRALVDEFGPLDLGERDKLLATLLARREALAQRFPNARPKVEAPAVVPTERVSEFEQREIEASRANGYTLATDGGDIEDHQVVAMAYTDAKGQARTRLALKLRPEAAARLQAALPAGASGPPVLVNFATAKMKGLELLKGLNIQASKGLPIRPDKEMPRLLMFKAALGAARRDLIDKLDQLTDAAAARKAMAKLDQLEEQLDAYFTRLKVGDTAEPFPTFDFDALPNQVLGRVPESAQASATPWARQGGFAYARAKLERGHVIEESHRLQVPGADHSYVAELDGARLAFVPDVSSNATSLRGYVQVDVDGTGAAATARALAELERLGVSATRATPEHRVELYLDRHLYLRSAKSADLEAEWLAIASEADQAVRIERKLALLNREAGFDVRTSPNWDPEGRRQAFGHGRLTQHRADLKPEEVAKFNSQFVMFHNPAGLSLSGGYSVLDRFKLLIESGGQLASQVDRIRRGVQLTGTSVSSDLSSGGASYVFTRLLSKRKGIKGHGAGFILKPELTQRLDAFSYSGDRFGTIDRRVQRQDRAVDLDGLRRNAGNAGNETNFRDSLSLFDSVEYIVLQSQGQVQEAIDFMRANGYTTWPDGRPLEEVIIPITRSPYKAKKDGWLK